MPEIRSILFVCTGNSCRSVMAEALLKRRLRELGKSGISVGSAGVHAPDGVSPTDETIEVMRDLGIDVSDFRARSITAEIAKEADLILVMEPLHKDEVTRMVPEAASKTYLLKEYRSSAKIGHQGTGIRDPIGRSVEDYRACRDSIKEEIERIVQLL